MSDYISREAALTELQNPELFNVSPRFLQILRDLPAADVEPVRNGRWEECDFGNETIAQAAAEKWIWRNNYGFVYENINFWSCVSGRLQR